MPKVEQYGLPQVTTQVVNQPRMNAAAGSRVFQSNIQAAKGVAQVGLAVSDMVQRIDTTSAEEALVSFEKEKND